MNPNALYCYLLSNDNRLRCERLFHQGEESQLQEGGDPLATRDLPADVPKLSYQISQSSWLIGSTKLPKEGKQSPETRNWPPAKQNKDKESNGNHEIHSPSPAAGPSERWTSSDTICSRSSCESHVTSWLLEPGC